MALMIAALGWFTTAWAAQVTQPDLLALPWAQIGMGAVLSAWGGMVATVGRVGNLPKGSFSWPAEIFKDATASTFAGALAYFIGAWWKVDLWQLALALGISGYLGRQAIDLIANVWRSRLLGPRP